MANVFVSYAQSDAMRINEIWSQLQARGLVTGTPRIAEEQIQAGDSFADAILRAIQGASSVVVLWSDDAARSSYVSYELGIAKALGKPILIVDLGSHQRPPVELGPVPVVDLQPSI